MSGGIDYRNNAGTGVVKADSFQVGSVSAPKVVLSGVITFDAPSLLTGAFAVSSGITIAGVALGDSIDLYPPIDVEGVIYQASPSAANTVKISLFNTNAATKDLASGSWGYAVKRRV